MLFIRSLMIGAGVSVALSGCALLGAGSEPLDTYLLSAPIRQPAAPSRTRTQILIAEPTALKILDGENIVVMPSRGAIEYLSGAQWADRLPRVVQSRLAEGLQESGRFGGVGKPGEGLAIDYQLIVDIRSFQVRLDGGSRAEVELFARILNDRNGVVRATRVFTASVPTSGAGNAAFVTAIDAAFAQVASEIVAWIAAAI